MAVLKCKMCGGDIEVSTTQTFGTCDHCGTTTTLPKEADEQKANLFNRANHFRRQNDFDKAISAFENILNIDNSLAEAHWGLVLAKYGIEYVEDPITHERVPTCHRVQSDSIITDADYLAALENAEDDYTKSLYENEARRISEIQRGILSISSMEKPYDVFICYKETTDGDSRTKDSTLAQDIYYQLTNEGYKVFFSRITLEEKLGQEYEPYIFAALNSAKVMVVVGTKPEYFHAIWVRNEWSRFLALLKKDRSKLLIPCYSNMDAYDLPEEMSMLQSQDMSKIGFIQDLIRGINKVLSVPDIKGSSETQKSGETVLAPGVAQLLDRTDLFLEDGDFKSANEYIDRILDLEPRNASAYFKRLLVSLKIHHENDILLHEKPLDDYGDYQKAIRFANESYRETLEGYNRSIIEKIENDRLEQIYAAAKEKLKCLNIQKEKYVENPLKCGNIISALRKLIPEFESIRKYKDSESLLETCKDDYLDIKRIAENYRAEEERKRAEEERVRAEEERVRIEEERVRTEAERVRVEAEKCRQDAARKESKRQAEIKRNIEKKKDIKSKIIYLILISGVAIFFFCKLFVNLQK